MNQFIHACINFIVINDNMYIRACLGLFSIPGPAIQWELNLIASLSLLDDFHVNMLPVQVRLCENKLDIVRAVLDSSPSAYRKYDKVLESCYLTHYFILCICYSNKVEGEGRIIAV